MIRHTTTPKRFALGCCLVAALASPAPALAQQEPAVVSAVQYLKGHALRSTGESAMIALALLKAEVPASDPVVQGCIAKVKARFASSAYQPELPPGTGTYEAGVSLMALATLGAEENRSYIATITAYLLSRQNGNGSWDYSNRTAGDCSISQYATLGLWEALNAGIDVSPAVWDRIASFYMSAQFASGAWNYHPDEHQPETLSMTAAGVGSLMICQRELNRFRSTRRETSALLTSLVPDNSHSDFKPSTSNVQLDQAIKRGVAWISANFAPSNAAIVGHTPYYMLYGIERIGALGERDTIGKVDWYTKGAEFLHTTQHPDGSWTGTFGTEMNTVWGTLFLTKSTAKSLRRIKIQKLGAGTLLGGRELPKDLSSLTVAGGRVVSRPMNGAVEGMLAVLEDPRAEQADAAVAGIVDRYYVQGPDALRPFKGRFRKMLSDRDHGVRQVAAWALAHTGDLDVAPLLIDALTVPDEDEDVISAIRTGLQLLSRKITGLGPPSPSSPADRQAAAARWRAWYQAIRPLDLEGQDDDVAATSTGKLPAPAAAQPGPGRPSP
jgi:hypothetical protein